MKQENLSQRILSKVETKIAIANFQKEEKKMSKNKILKIVATFVITIGVMMGVAYAGSVIYERIWKEPQRVILEEEPQITPEIVDKNITEEEAKEIAQKKLIQLGIQGQIVGTDHYTVQGTEEIMYRFLTDDQWFISINGKTGEFFEIWNLQKYSEEWKQHTLSKSEATQVAKELYQKLGYREGEYQLMKLIPQTEDGDMEKEGYEFDARFYKKYDDLYNGYECVSISFYVKDKILRYYRVENDTFDNNPVEITKEEAIEIATKEDRKVEKKEIISTEAELRIEKMNGNAYARLHNTEEYYKPMTTTDVPLEEQVQYQTENRVRRVWVVSFNYGEELGTDVVTRYAKGTYSYFVDATTGEIIGGTTSDYLRWNNFWEKQYAVEN